MSGGWNPEKVKIFKAAFYEFLDHVTINSKETGGNTQLAECLYESQKFFYEEIFSGLENDIHDFKIGKARQLGISVACRPLMLFWIGWHPGMQGAMVYDTGEHKDEARGEIEWVIDNLPKHIRFPKKISCNRNMLKLDNGSNIRFMSAGVKKSRAAGTLGRSSGINLVHACLAPGTLVLVEHGKVKPIEDIEIGEKIVTHTGTAASVIANIGQPNTKGDMLEISPWLGIPFLCTEDHKICTARGLVKSGTLKKDDLLVMPIREITHTIKSGRLPKTPKRPQNGGSISAASGKKIEFTEDFGFAIGYYLAEGSMVYQRRGKEYYDFPSGLIFTRHRNEKPFANRAIGALKEFTTGKRTTKDNPKSLTTTEHIYGSCLARWVNDNFGAQDHKRIPDYVFSWGEDFCRGLVAGLLSGDGSKTPSRGQGYTINKVNLVSTRPSIAFQMRDLAASLGYGWASIKTRKAGQYYGRNCKQIWMVNWCGEAGASLRKLMGLKVYKSKSKHIEKYKIDSGHVLIKIRSIKTGFAERSMYDLSVDHKDHTFRLPAASVSNSEMCSWENQEGISAFKNSLAENFPDRLYIWESTARGFNEWFNMWSEAQNDTTHQKAIFIGWWRKEIYSIPRDHRDFEKYGLDAPTETETKRIKTVKEEYGYDIAPEQLAWWRKKIDPSGMREDGEPEDSFKIEDFPWDEEEMFLATGSKFFDVEKLTENIRKAATTKYQSYRFWPGSDFLTCSIAKAQTWRDVNLKIWEDADPSSVYVIAADPAFGHDPNNDRSACQVLKCYADGIEQVAEFADATVTTDQFAWLILALAGRYSGCTEGWNNPVHIILEINGPGEAVWNAIKAVKAVISDGYLKMQAKDMGLGNIFQNVRNYIYSRSDSMTTGHNFHFKTTTQLKIAILERLRDMNNAAIVTIQSRETLEEMRTLTRNGDSISAEGRAKDDRVISLALGIHQWESAVRRNMIAHRRTKSAEVARKAADPRSRFQLFNQFQMNVRLKHKTAVRAQAKIALAKERWRNQKSWTRHTWGRM